MDFTASVRMSAPRAAVFDALTEFDRLEARAAEQGIAVTRTAAPAGLVGTGWTARFAMRGKEREAQVTLVEVSRPERLHFTARTGGLETGTVIALADAEDGGTLLEVHAEMQPRTLSARLIVQSLRLARAKMTARFEARVAGYARDLDARLAGG